MRINEILNEAETPKVDIEHYGNWTISMSKDPVIMKAITGDTAQFVAKVTNKRRPQAVFFGVGTTQGAARDDAMSKAVDQERPDMHVKYSLIQGKLNVPFFREYSSDNRNTYVKFIKDDIGNTSLVLANDQYAREFGKSLSELGFSRCTPTPNFGMNFTITGDMLSTYGLIPNMRYSLSAYDTDNDGNQLFQLIPESRSQGPWDKMIMRTPGLTIAAIPMRDTINK